MRSFRLSGQLRRRGNVSAVSFSEPRYFQNIIKQNIPMLFREYWDIFAPDHIFPCCAAAVHDSESDRIYALFRDVNYDLYLSFLGFTLKYVLYAREKGCTVEYPSVCAVSVTEKPSESSCRAFSMRRRKKYDRSVSPTAL